MKSHRNWRGVVRDWGVRLGVMFLAALWMLVLAVSWANAELTDGTESEYRFEWLDPDKKIYVLQNRKYLKARRLLVSATVGTGLSQPYRTTFNVTPRVAYYLSELFGFETFYMHVMNQENNTFSALKVAAPNTLPVVREIRSHYGLLAHFVPWYAKINVFNSVLYFDWYFSAGAGAMGTAVDSRTSAAAASNFTLENLFAIYVGTGHQYHLSQGLTVRLDFTGAFYQAPIFGNSGESSWFSDYNFSLGMGLRL